jgi:hypothetical protein
MTWQVEEFNHSSVRNATINNVVIIWGLDSRFEGALGFEKWRVLWVLRRYGTCQVARKNGFSLYQKFAII